MVVSNVFRPILSLLVNFQRIRTKRPDFFSHQIGFLGKLTTHRSRNINHFYTVAFQSNFLKSQFDGVYSSFCLEITFQVMAVARQSTCHHHTISAILKCLQDVDRVHLASARHFNNLNR